jgi:hypothetical protein
MRSDQRCDKGDKWWHTLDQRLANTSAARATQSQLVRSEERDAGKEGEQAQINDICPTDGLIAVYPDDDTGDEAASNEQVVEPDIECPEAYRRDVDTWNGEDTLMHTRPLEQQVSQTKARRCTTAVASAKIHTTTVTRQAPRR